MVQVAVGARVVQAVVETKLGVVLVGGAIWRVAEPVLVRVMKITWTKQEVLGAREPLQAGPPVGAVVESARVKLPVVVGVEREIAAGVRLVSVKRVGALVLWTGMGPKSCVMGVR